MASRFSHNLKNLLVLLIAIVGVRFLMIFAEQQIISVPYLDPPLYEFSAYVHRLLYGSRYY